MLTDYMNQYYIPQAERTDSVVANNYALARKIASWKKHLRREWENVNVISETQTAASYDLSTGNEFQAEVVLNIGDLRPEDIGVETIFASTDRHGALHIADVREYTPVEFADGVCKYQVSILPERTGSYQVATRVFAKNPLLPHRQDFELVRWL